MESMQQDTAMEMVLQDQIACTPRRFSVEEYYRMGEAGILTEDERIELIDGCIVVREPANPPHSGGVNRIAQILTTVFRDRAIIAVQNPFKIDEFNHPQPDIAVLRPRNDFYATAHPGGNDTFLLIEVSHTSQAFDQRVKAPLYAHARIREYWIVNIPERLLEIYREPTANGYSQVTRWKPESEVVIQAFPDDVLPVSDIIGV